MNEHSSSNEPSKENTDLNTSGDTSSEESHSELRAQIRAAFESGGNTTERVKQIFERAIRETSGSFSKVPGILQAGLLEVLELIGSFTPDEQKRRIGEIFSLLEEIVTATLNSVSLSIQELKGRGETLASQEVSSLVQELKTLGLLLAETLQRFSSRTAGVLSEESAQIQQHIGRLVMRTGPLVASLLSSLSSLSGEATKDVSSSLGGMLAGVLRGVADKVSPMPSDNKGEKEE